MLIEPIVEYFSMELSVLEIFRRPIEGLLFASPLLAWLYCGRRDVLVVLDCAVERSGKDLPVSLSRLDEPTESDVDVSLGGLKM